MGSSDIEMYMERQLILQVDPNRMLSLWRKFAGEPQKTEAGWDDESTHENSSAPQSRSHTKKVLNALMKSFEDGFVEVKLVVASQLSSELDDYWAFSYIKIN
jgi:hypothetical protein